MMVKAWLRNTKLTNTAIICRRQLMKIPAVTCLHHQQVKVFITVNHASNYYNQKALKRVQISANDCASFLAV